MFQSGVDWETYHFLRFPTKEETTATPCHASTPFCGVVMLTLEFDQLEVPCLDRGRAHITFHCFTAVLYSQTEHSAGQI